MPFSSYYASLWKVIGSERRIFVVFIDLKRAYEKIPRTVIWWAIEKHKVPRKYITSSRICTIMLWQAFGQVIVRPIPY